MLPEVDQSRTETLPVANHPKLDVLLFQLANVVFKKTAKQAEQPVDFGFGAAPVFKGKGKGGQPADVTFARVAGNILQRFRALTVTADRRQTPLTRPATVTIHYNGKVMRNFDHDNSWLRQAISGLANGVAIFAILG